MAGEIVTFRADSGEASGYLTLPRAGGGPGVVVIQEWWGLVPHIKDVAERFADAGFLALAPDLYHGKAAKSPDEAGELMMALNIDQAERDLSGAVSYLQKHQANTTGKVGSVGFCMGGALSLFAASRNPDLNACVVFYGGHPKVKPDLAALRAPVLGLYAGRDKSVTPEVVRDLDRQLTDLGKTHEFHTYPDAQHAFFNDQRPEVYSRADAEDAWMRTVAFFRKYLTEDWP
jgi:carboxymethylenebutenolidase